MSFSNEDHEYRCDFANPMEIVASCISFVYAAPAFYIVVRLCLLYWRGRLEGSFQKLICLFGINLWGSYGWILILFVAASMPSLTYPTLLTGAKFHKIGPAAYHMESTSEVDKAWMIKTFYLYLTGSFLCFALNIYTGVTHYYLKKKRNRSVHLMEIKFFHVCVTTLACQVLLITIQTINHHTIARDSPRRIIFRNTRSIIFDINCFLPLYSLLLLSKEIRGMVIPKLTRKSSITTINSTF